MCDVAHNNVAYQLRYPVVRLEAFCSAAEAPFKNLIEFRRKVCGVLWSGCNNYGIRFAEWDNHMDRIDIVCAHDGLRPHTFACCGC